MKRKLLMTILTLTLALCSIVGLTACGHEHSYTDSVTAPTCTKQGYTTHTCSCGHSYVDNYVDALEHDFKDYVYNNDAKCEIDGTETATCSRSECNETHTRTKEGSALEHDFKDYVYNNDAKCEIDGTETATCSRSECNETHTRTKEGSALEHDFKDYAYNNDAKCEQDGTETATCSRSECNETHTRTKEGSALEHDFKDYVYNNDAKCEIDGTETATCSRSECNETHTRTKEGSALEHDFKEYVSDNNATYEKDGTKTATCSREGCNETHTITDAGTKLESGISFSTLSVEGTAVYGKVSNATETFSFIDEVAITGTAKFIVSLDAYGMQSVATKTISLSPGDNKVYVIEMIDDEATDVYEVVVRRKPMYTVSFNTNGGTAVDSQMIEEDSLATEPTTTRAGYTFIDWDYDFTTPITSDKTINASWLAHTNTPYKVEYYLENLENDDYSILSTATENLTGTTDTTANAEIKTFSHFTHRQSSTDSLNINGDGSTVLKVYYTRDKYTITVNSDNTKAGSVVGSGNYKYEEEITLTATTNAGYTFLGWFNGETSLSSNVNYTFNVDKNIEIMAKWTANTNTPYKVEYYLENLENDDYSILSTATENLTGTTDTTATIEPKDIEHFTFNEGYNLNVLENNINGDGSTVLKVYYTRDKYTITVNNDNTKAGSVVGSGKYKYEEEITLTATINAGYTFLGWFNGETSLSSNVNYTFNVDKDIEITARFAVKSEMANFNFTSTATTCNITGLKDEAITEIIVPNYVTSIGERVFRYCDRLVEVINKSPSITVTKGSTNNGYIGYYALAVFNSTDTYENKFTNDNGYIIYNNGEEKVLCRYEGEETNLTLPNYITSINEYAFRGCGSLTSVTIGDSVTRIGEYAFHWCSSLTRIVIPDSVTSIGDYAFYDCSSLTSITIGNSVTRIGEYAFASCGSLTSVTIGDSVTSIGDSAFSCCSSLTSITIGNSVTRIGEYAFASCGSLTSVTIGDSVTSIGERAFYSCDSLTSIEISNSVTSIGERAFEDCSSLTSIVIPDSVTSIGDYAFFDCSSLTSITIGNSVTRIGEYAFASCGSLTSVTIGYSVTSIGIYAFSRCSSLTSIQYNGTKSQWNSISKGANWAYYVNATVYCTDGTITI